MFKNGFKLAAGAYVGWSLMSAVDEFLADLLDGHRDQLVKKTGDALSNLIFRKK